MRPATGPTDLPEPDPFDADAPFKTFVSQLLALRLRADRRGRPGYPRRRSDDPLSPPTWWPRRPGSGTSSRRWPRVLDADWVEDLDDELGWISRSRPRRTPARDGCAARLRSERYLTVLERLVSAVRAPNSPSLSRLPAGEVLGDLIDDARAEALTAAEGVAADSGEQAWDGRLAGAEPADLSRALRLAEIGATGPAVGRAARARPGPDGFAVIMDRVRQADELQTQVAAADSAVAFELGRRYERKLGELADGRAEFVRRWAKSTRSSAEDVDQAEYVDRR